jgi:hypothetical protein
MITHDHLYSAYKCRAGTGGGPEPLGTHAAALPVRESTGAGTVCRGSVPGWYQCRAALPGNSSASIGYYYRHWAGQRSHVMRVSTASAHSSESTGAGLQPSVLFGRVVSKLQPRRGVRKAHTASARGCNGDRLLSPASLGSISSSIEYLVQRGFIRTKSECSPSRGMNARNFCSAGWRSAAS